ncbi:MAG: FAD-dependent oxidoreductase, partial [Phycisphaerales bacterium]
MDGAHTQELVLVGGGHAHVHVLEGFAADPPPDVRVTLVVDTPIAVYSGMVPGFVAGQYTEGDLQIDLRPLARRAGVEVITTRAVGIEATERRILLDEADPITYDIACFNIGSTVAGLDLPGVREHALPTRPIGRFVGRVDELLGRARAHDGGSPFRVIVVGAGAGGVELAFTVQHRLAAETGRAPAMQLLDGGPRILAGYPPSLARRVKRLAASRGIEILHDTRVASAEAGAVVLADGSRLPCDALIWVTGAVSQPIFTASGLPTDDRGFLRIRSTLQADGHDDLFGCGDCATLIDYPRTPKAGVYAVRQGPLVTDNLRAALAGGPLRPYRPQRDFLTLLNAGGGVALGAKWGRSFQGRWVMTLKD